jgi:hypothetical protein
MAATVACLAVVMMSACGGSSAGKLPINDILGNIPSLIYQKAKQDSTYKAEAKSETSGIRDAGKMEKLFKKYEKLKNETDAAYEANMEKASSGLKDKNIPFTQAEGLPYEITGVKFAGVSSKGKVEISVVAKVTNASKLEFPNSNGKWFYTPLECLNKSGDVLYRDSYAALDFENSAAKSKAEVRNGMEFQDVMNFTISAKDAQKFVDFAKVNFR